MKKIVRATTVAMSLNTFCRGLLRDLSADYEVIALSGQDKDLEEIAEREGVRTIGVHMERHISPLGDLVSLLRLTAVFLRERPYMVHSMTPKAGLLCMIAAWVARVPVRVHTFTGLVWPTATGLQRKVLMTTDWLTCACATHIVPEGEGVRNDLLGGGITRKPMRVLGHGNVRGIDLTHYDRTPEVTAWAADIRRELGLAATDFCFVFVGRLVGDKGINELAEAFCRLAEELPELHLLLVGREEPELDPLREDTRRRLHGHDRVHLVGQKADVRPWYAAADALAFPSYREGFPNVVIEAGAMGLPSIVTDINGSREIIRQGENGVIVPSKDATALYEAMRRMVTQRDITAGMAAKARDLIASRYEQGYVHQCLKEFYREIMG